MGAPVPCVKPMINGPSQISELDTSRVMFTFHLPELRMIPNHMTEQRLRDAGKDKYAGAELLRRPQLLAAR
jgi:hypothetical protein